VKEPFAERDWEKKVRTRIRQANLVIVICGEHTHTATGVATELRIAREEKQPYFLLWGYSGKTCYKPTTALETDKIYKWEWDILKKLVRGNADLPSSKLQSRTPEQYGDKYQDHLLEQYKLFVETAQHTSDKRRTQTTTSSR